MWRSTSVNISFILLKREREKRLLNKETLSELLSDNTILVVPVSRYRIINTIPRVNGITNGSKPNIILSFKVCSQ